MTDQTTGQDSTQVSAETSMASAVGFADAETREILNLLGNDTDASEGGCCGGSCCSA